MHVTRNCASKYFRMVTIRPRAATVHRRLVSELASDAPPNPALRTMQALTIHRAGTGDPIRAHHGPATNWSPRGKAANGGRAHSSEPDSSPRRQ